MESRHGPCPWTHLWSRCPRPRRQQYRALRHGAVIEDIVLAGRGYSMRLPQQSPQVNDSWNYVRGYGWRAGSHQLGGAGRPRERCGAHCRPHVVCRLARSSGAEARVGHCARRLHDHIEADRLRRATCVRRPTSGGHAAWPSPESRRPCLDRKRSGERTLSLGAPTGATAFRRRRSLRRAASATAADSAGDTAASGWRCVADCGEFVDRKRRRR